MGGSVCVLGMFRHVSCGSRPTHPLLAISAELEQLVAFMPECGWSQMLFSQFTRQDAFLNMPHVARHADDVYWPGRVVTSLSNFGPAGSPWAKQQAAFSSTVGFGSSVHM